MFSPLPPKFCVYSPRIKGICKKLNTLFASGNLTMSLNLEVTCKLLHIFVSFCTFCRTKSVFVVKREVEGLIRAEF